MKRFKANPGWPESLYRLVTAETKTRRAKYSITELIQPPLMLQLKRRHEHEIEYDPADMLWRIFGSLVHGKLERFAGANALVEEGIVMEILGVPVSGQPDLYENETLWDFKVTSVYSVMRGMKDEWEAQVNGYAYLLRHCGFPVSKAFIVAILRDWSRTGAKFQEQYPQSQIQILPVLLWPENEAKVYLESRVRLHEHAEKLSDDELVREFPCTDNERWMREPKFAVIKPGQKRALKLFDNIEEADQYAKTIPGAVVEERKGEYVRCENYCDAYPFCRLANPALKTVEQALQEAGL